MPVFICSHCINLWFLIFSLEIEKRLKTELGKNKYIAVFNNHFICSKIQAELFT